MKVLISLGVFVIGCYLGYLFDSWVIGLILKEIPESANEWMGLIKITMWICMVLLTGGFIIGVSAFIASLFSINR